MKNVKIIGILNITPDSFSDGGLYFNPDKAIKQAQKLFNDGANIVDIGGESTRPGAKMLKPEEEWARIALVVEKLCKKFTGKISIDTRNFSTAEKFCQAGGTILNDVSGFQDPRMINVAVKYQTLCLVNHFPGKTVEEVHTRHLRSPKRIARDLIHKKKEMLKAGILNNNIVLDPGIGFGKTMKCNWELLKFGQVLPHEKILIGHSRKRFLGKNRFDIEVNHKAAQIAIANGASYLRVHEVRDCPRILEK